MSRLDITKTKLYITEFLLAMQSSLGKIPSPRLVSSRHSDAFVYVVSGECEYIFSDGQRLVASEGDLLYLAHLSSYEMRVRTDVYRCVWCDFFFGSNIPRSSDVYRVQEGADAEGTMKRIRRLYTSSAEYTELVSLLYKIYGMAIASRKKSYLSPASRRSITDAALYIGSSFGDPSLSVSALASRCGMSEVYFRKLFAEEMGCQPSKYICSVRLKNAADLLKYGFVTLEECARECGFSSVQYFNRVFKAEYGVTPAKFRKIK